MVTPPIWPVSAGNLVEVVSGYQGMVAIAYQVGSHGNENNSYHKH